MKLWIKWVTTVLLLSVWGCSEGTSNFTDRSDNQAGEQQVVTKDKKVRPNKRQESTTSGEIYISVDRALKPAIEAELNSFLGTYDEATIHPIYLPGEEAIAAMIESDSIRIAIATRKLTEEEEDMLEIQHTFADYSTIGKEGIVLIANQNNPIDTLNAEQWRGIFSGELENWKQISPQVGLKNISVVFDNNRSSAVRFLQDSVFEGKQIAGDNIFALDSAEAVMNYIKENDNAVGLLGFSWISDWDDPKVRKIREGTKILAIGGVAVDSLCPYDIDAFRPYQTYLTTDCYPLIRTIYTIRREITTGLGTGLVAYMAGPRGQRILHKHGIAAIKGIPRQVRFPDKKGAKDPLKTKIAK
ncbi:MAG: substrate-binding domain-containing protein [Bacteroidota bacterium]